jgi:hypothetical protein
LNLKNQAVAADINSHLLHLTRDNVDDSATVRVVTLVTLIYLPASFVAVCLHLKFNLEGLLTRILDHLWDESLRFQRPDGDDQNRQRFLDIYRFLNSPDFSDCWILVLAG